MNDRSEARSGPGNTAALHELPRLSFAVMTHPSRLAHAESLVESHPELDAQIVTDPDPDAPPSSVRTARLAWAAADTASTHHVVLQEDIALTPDFLATLRLAVQSHPDAALSLFTHWGSHLSYAARLAALGGLNWAESVGTYTPTVALVLPTAVAKETAWALHEADTRHDDVAIRRHLLKIGTECLLTVPGLVEHLNLPSISGNESHGIRKSACFMEEPGLIDGWGSRVFRPVMLPYIDKTTGRLECHLWEVQHRERPRQTDPTAELERHGFGPEAIWRSLARIWPHAGMDAPTQGSAISAEHVLTVWTAAHLLGIAAGRCYGATDPAAIELAITRPTAHAALSTMAQGALRNQISADAMERAREKLLALVVQGVNSGWQSAVDRCA